MIATYHRQYEGFTAEIELRDDLPPGLLVSDDRLLISPCDACGKNARACASQPRDRRAPAHLFQRFGSRIAAFPLGSCRLRGHARRPGRLFRIHGRRHDGRTVAPRRGPRRRLLGMLEGRPFAETYNMLVGEHGFGPAAAFNLTLRLYRGGGLAKDAIYLRGLLGTARAPEIRRCARSVLDGQDFGFTFPRDAGTQPARPAQGARHPSCLPHRSSGSGPSRQGAGGNDPTRHDHKLGAAMRIAFFVNSIESEEPGFTTTALAMAAVARGHDVCYVAPGDFVLRPDDSLMVGQRRFPRRNTRIRRPFTTPSRAGCQGPDHRRARGRRHLPAQ